MTSSCPLLLADIRAAHPVLWVRFTSAPFSISSCTTSPCPFWLAAIRAVHPLSSAWFTSAPASISSRTTSPCPLLACYHKSRPFIVIGYMVYLGTLFNQPPYGLYVSVLACHHKSRPLIVIDMAYLGTLFNK